MRIAGQLSFLRVNVIRDDLVSLTFIFHFCSQFSMVRKGLKSELSFVESMLNIPQVWSL